MRKNSVDIRHPDRVSRGKERNGPIRNETLHFWNEELFSLLSGWVNQGVIALKLLFYPGY